MTTDAQPPAEATPRTFSISIERVTVQGKELQLPVSGVTAIVGGNNVGKSTLLREIHAWITRSMHTPAPTTNYLVQDLKFRREGDLPSLKAWLDENTEYVDQPHPGYRNMRAGHDLLMEIELPQVLTGNTLGTFGSFVTGYSTPLDRGQVVEPVAQRPDSDAAPTHPLHALLDDASLMSALSDLSQAIFRTPLTLDRLGGHSTLRVGRPSVPTPPVDAVTAEYRQAIGACPKLKDQGDGMRSLIGLLLPLIASTTPIILLDEPEAFLHPPQAYQLGARLAAIAKTKGLQIILATHDKNLVAGLLSAKSDVSIVRLDREETTTRVHQLPPDSVRELLADPVLRYSNVLDALFHRLAVVAEADPDCRFFQASLDALNEGTPLTASPGEVLFLPSGGRDGMVKIVRALKAVEVRVLASPDLDLLENQAQLQRLTEAFGIPWDDIDTDYKVATNGFGKSPVTATCADVLQQVRSALEGHEQEPWTKETKKLITAATRTSHSNTGDLSKLGVASFQGGARTAAESLLTHLEASGICCVRAGDLEHLAPLLGVSKGPAWLPAALEAGAQRDKEAQEHISRLATAAGLVETATPEPAGDS